MNEALFPPRGSGQPGRIEFVPSQIWCHPDDLGPGWTWRPSMPLLGRWRGRLLGHADDRHLATLAGARGGKTSTVLIPNLLRYPGSVVVLDPKGELARATAAARRAMGQRVFVLDPFGETGEPKAQHNPLAELGYGKAEHIAPDAAQAADALIIGNARDPHWTDSAKNLTRGFILLDVSDKRVPTLRSLRSKLNGTPADLDRLFVRMVETSAFDGVVANIGASFLGKKESGGRELQSILSTAQEQTTPLDDVVTTTDRSDFSLRDLHRGDMTVYLVLPGMRMGTHYRWLRLVIQQALGAVERAPVPRGGLPVWFMLEEFATLGHMRSIEVAAGLMAGFGVKLWPVLQDLTQLQTHYAKSWETFLGNAGIIQAFGNVDTTTTEHLSKMMGNTRLIEFQDTNVSSAATAHGDLGRREHIRTSRLIDPAEIAFHFARETNRQLILVPGRPPIYMDRLPPEPHRAEEAAHG